jgi:hypothetical protein
MNISKWLDDMQRLYNSLCDLDPERLSDHDYALTVLDLMPQDDSWRDFLSTLRSKVREYNAQALPVDSSTLTTSIREEYWIKHRDDYQTTSHIFSARHEAQRRSATKRPRTADLIATSTSPTKRPRPTNPDKANLQCNNPYCRYRNGHDTNECIAYKGTKEGQYSEWWRGPWNIHLPENQRSKDNNIPPKSHPAYARLQRASINQSHTSDNSLDRSTTTHIVTLDDDTQVNSTLESGQTFHAWSTLLNNENIHMTLPILNNALLRDNSCNYDSGANHHVFHDRSVFEQYENITPLTVKGFGQNLSALAIGRGTVRLESQHSHPKHSILLHNVLHIPAARSNLISGVQLDKAGVISTLGNKCITLSVNNQIIVRGTVTNDMYRLDINIATPTRTSLESRITPPPLSSRIGPKVSSSHTSPAFCTA